MTSVIPEKRIAEFVERMQASEGSNLQSIVLYGSAASGTYDPEFSDLNLLCILMETNFDAISRVAPIAQWWSELHRPPLLVGRSELEHSTDVFSIEMLEIREHYRVLLGDDIIRQLQIPMHLHRAQLEYELREKTILLREQLLLALGHERRTWNVLMLSFSPLITLFRHALMAAGDPRPGNAHETLRAIASKFSCSTEGFSEALEVREHRKRQSDIRLRELVSNYLNTVEHVAAAVDRMLDSAALRP